MKTALIFFALLALGCSAVKPCPPCVVDGTGPSACERQLTICLLNLQMCRGEK